MPATQTTRDHHIVRDRRRQERLILLVAVALTVTMFGWQGSHLYWANRSASHQETTALVEAVHGAGRHQADLVADLERDALLADQEQIGPEATDWADRYAAASAETHAAVTAALEGAGEALAGPVGEVDSTRIELDHRVDDVVARLSEGSSPTAALDPAFSSARAAFERAVDGQLAGLAAELDAGTAAERLDELHSVVVALALFSTAIGAWAIFLRRLRRSRAQLAEEQEQRRQAEATSAQLQQVEALGLMADGVAHDVKNLTTIISGSVDDARRQLSDGHPATAALARIEQATHQADELARALLAVSHRSRLPQRAVDLADLVTSTTRLIRYLVPPPVELVVETPAAAWVRGDAAQLQQAVLNLVANARDAMPDGGRLTIAVRPTLLDAGDDAGWLLVVQDTGEGMSADVRRRLFEPFFTTRPDGTGSGLGLPIVARIVEDHGGTIEVSSREGEGSTFTIAVPAVAAPSRPPEPEHHDDALVLVAHPDAYVRDLIGGALVADGHRVVSASTGAETVARLRGDGPNVAVAVVDAALLPDGALRSAVPAEVRVVLMGERAPAVDVGDDPDVRLLAAPLSLAALTDSVGSLLRPIEARVPS